MFYIVKDHSFADAVLSILQLFFFGEEIKQVDTLEQTGIVIESILKENTAICTIYEKGLKTQECTTPINDFEKDEIRRFIKLSIYNAVKKIRNITMPWGILTGIRPAKKINEMRKSGVLDKDIKNILKEKHLVFEEKIDLAIKVADVEKKIIENNSKNKISIYIGIPFCPTRCVYCSFPSYSVSQYISEMDLYLDSLEKEIMSFKREIENFEIETIYIGGGTPTSFNEYQFERLLNIIAQNFKYPNLEYTIEAGRADTISKNKLILMKKYGSTRISLNPQTMNDKTLKLIGRNHLEKEFLDSFYLARELGHSNINTDIILGLLEEGMEELLYTMEKIFDLKPENLTVHTLSVKRASRLKENLKDFNPNSFYTMENMVNTTFDYTKKMGMYPYYMYRQKNMLGNFENVGYCKAGFECVYNVQIMEEKQSIIAFGSGASSKFYYEKDNRVERVFNVKSVDHYINRIDEMIQRKKDEFERFYRKG